MKPGMTGFLLLVYLVGSPIAAAGAFGFSWSLVFWVIVVYLALFIARCFIPGWPERQAHAWSIRSHYRPRPTDAGRWVNAPIAEVDKSTVGKLLASRMGREPGLHVVVRGRTPDLDPLRADALYDPEIDG